MNKDLSLGLLLEQRFRETARIANQIRFVGGLGLAQEVRCLLSFLGRKLKGQTNWDKGVSAKIYGFLRFSAKSAVFCASEMLFPTKSENLQKSAKICEFGSVCPF